MRTTSWREKIGRCMFVLCCLALAMAGVLLAQTSPRGTFKIESVTKAPPPDRDDADVSEFVVSTTDPKAKEPLNDHAETTHVSYHISPDENRIFESSNYGFQDGGRITVQTPRRPEV
jgi:hypothetical protein